MVKKKKLILMCVRIGAFLPHERMSYLSHLRTKVAKIICLPRSTRMRTIVVLKLIVQYKSVFTNTSRGNFLSVSLFLLLEEECISLYVQRGQE